MLNLSVKFLQKFFLVTLERFFWTKNFQSLVLSKGGWNCKNWDNFVVEYISWLSDKQHVVTSKWPQVTLNWPWNFKIVRFQQNLVSRVNFSWKTQIWHWFFDNTSLWPLNDLSWRSVSFIWSKWSNLIKLWFRG